MLIERYLLLLQGLCGGAVLGQQIGNLLRRLFRLTDVAHIGGKEEHTADVDRNDRELNREQCAAGMQCGGLDAPVQACQGWPIAVRQETLHAIVVGFLQIRRHQQAVHQLAQTVVLVSAKHFFRRRVESHNAAGRVQRNDGVDGRLQHRIAMGLAGLHLLVQALFDGSMAFQIETRGQSQQGNRQADCQRGSQGPARQARDFDHRVAVRGFHQHHHRPLSQGRKSADHVGVIDTGSEVAAPIA